MLILGAILITILLSILIGYNLYFTKLFKQEQEKEEQERIERLTKFYNTLKTKKDEHLSN